MVDFLGTGCFKEMRILEGLTNLESLGLYLNLDLDVAFVIIDRESIYHHGRENIEDSGNGGLLLRDPSIYDSLLRLDGMPPGRDPECAFAQRRRLQHKLGEPSELTKHHTSPSELASF
ncbi:unnamed protein product [Calicophoron daubneyi]|uniref:Uncharacterized protein n=1 Tax=Calicophoron daubneyi TaxID=300641 RepID=A0AAV2TP93_CALDB